MIGGGRCAHAANHRRRQLAPVAQLSCQAPLIFIESHNRPCSSCVQILEPAAHLAEAAETGDAEDALLDVTRACHSLCFSARLADLLGALGSADLEQFLLALAQLTRECIVRGGLSVDNATEWKGQATSAARHCQEQMCPSESFCLVTWCAASQLKASVGDSAASMQVSCSKRGRHC